MNEIKTEQVEIKYSSPSGLCTHDRCPARYFFKHILRLRSRDAFTIPLDYGKCIHCAMPEAYNNPDEALKIFSREWSKFSHEENDPKRNTTRAKDTFEAFHQSHSSQICPYIPLDPPSGTIESAEKYTDYEAPFLVDIGAKYPLYGKIDRFVKWTTDDSIWVLDYKTSSEVSARIFKNFENSLQTLIYTLAGSYLHGESVNGMIIELLRTSKVNAESALHLLFVNQEWLETLINWAQKEIFSIYRANVKGLWTKNPNGCAPYGSFGSPGYTCDYSLLCDLDNWREGVKFFDTSDYKPF